MTDENAEKRRGQIILAWWSTELGDRKTGVQKALSARLRRGDDVTVLCQPAVHDLSRKLGLKDGVRLARLARLLAHVREHGPTRLPRLLGRGDPKAMTALRFERLVHSAGADLEAAIRRALPLVGHRANVAHLGDAVLFWSDKTRTHWCFDYYGGETPLTDTSKEFSQ
ncbi:type I-E CRISPR-associated protein Cse2/CasB [Pseudooceanicola aestuarii]|uniref:type I-E CRISPR-associated protein Cse2/CasB n=1 Tax=Pseudooceanicola aestuarii TaxID=2697319 RepID=UPI0013D3F850|nr:type I-E CRISPR-associated protein Cse2/CasB [Pseudooceanicola aestuarii]